MNFPFRHHAPTRVLSLGAVLFLLLSAFCWAAEEDEAESPAPKSPEPSATALPFSHDLPNTPFDAPPGTWTLVVLPDTQYYSSFYPEVFNRQTEWIAANKEKHNILFVVHEGDITDKNRPQEWERARAAMDILNQAKVPYALTCGNHEYISPGDKSDRPSPLINRYFKASEYSNSEKVGFFEPGKMENSWHTFTTPTGKYLVLALEFGPRDSVLEWANQTAASMPDHKVIMVTHGYLYHDDTRYDWTTYGPKQAGNPKKGQYVRGSVNDGEDMWQKLVSKHSNFQFVLSGHVCGDGKAYRADKGDAGNVVHQILINFQDGRGSVKPHRGWGGGGFLRLMQFLPDGQTVRVRTYSPWYDQWLTGTDYEYDLDVRVPRGSKLGE
jgi:Calcineurin-like phosphoesterase